jgi:hypothetical protein
VIWISPYARVHPCAYPSPAERMPTPLHRMEPLSNRCCNPMLTPMHHPSSCPDPSRTNLIHQCPLTKAYTTTIPHSLLILLTRYLGHSLICALTLYVLLWLFAHLTACRSSRSIIFVVTIHTRLGRISCRSMPTIPY